MKTEWLCDNCYKQACLMLGVKEIEQYTDVNYFDQICPNCKNKIGKHHIVKYKICLNCKFWRFIRNEDYKNWKGPHGECGKINYFSFKEKAWLDNLVTYIDENLRDLHPLRLTHDLSGNELFQESSLITKPNFGCNLFEDKDK